MQIQVGRSGPLRAGNEWERRAGQASEVHSRRSQRVSASGFAQVDVLWTMGRFHPRYFSMGRPLYEIAQSKRS